MRKVNWHIALCLCFYFCLMPALAASPLVSSISGIVVNKQNRAIPGLSVYLIDPEGRRAGQQTTDNFGRFAISNVHRRSEAYYVEIYWGKQLYARKPVIVDRDVNLGNIVL